MLRLAVAAAAILVGAGAAGSPEPVRIRQVVIDGVRGSGYYSVVEQGYRMVGSPAPVLDDALPGSRMMAERLETRTAAVADESVVSADDLSQAIAGSGPESGL